MNYLQFATLPIRKSASPWTCGEKGFVEFPKQDAGAISDPAHNNLAFAKGELMHSKNRLPAIPLIVPVAGIPVCHSPSK